MPDPINPSAPHDPTREPELNAAAERVAADVDAVRDDDLEPINRDPNGVVTTVLGANRLVQKYLPELEKMPGLDMARIRKLGDYADALLYWHGSATYAQPSKPEVAAMIERALIIRERTLHDLGALVRHGQLDGALLTKFGDNAAHRKVASDLVGLSNLVHERWAELNGKTLITLAAMDEASALGKAIMQALGDRDLAQAELARDIARRNKAYTLVVRTYEELRSAVTFLRRAEGDADKIAPSLFALGRRGKKDEEEEAPAATPAAPAPSTLGPTKSSLIVPDDARG